MASEPNLTRYAYVENIPLNATEKDMQQLFNQVGEAINFRITRDRKTQISKGIGYCEYKNSKCVDLAVRDLNGFLYKGIALTVKRADAAESQNNLQNNEDNKDDNNDDKKARENEINKQNKLRIKNINDVKKVINSLTDEDKREILIQMKHLLKHNQKKAEKILLNNPQLAKALLLIQIQHNLITPDDIRQLSGVIDSHEIGTTTANPINVGNNNPVNNNSNNNNNNNNNIEVSNINSNSNINKNGNIVVNNTSQKPDSKAMNIISQPKKQKPMPMNVDKAIKKIKDTKKKDKKTMNDPRKKRKIDKINKPNDDVIMKSNPNNNINKNANKTIKGNKPKDEMAKLDNKQRDQLMKILQMTDDAVNKLPPKARKTVMGIRAKYGKSI